MNSFQMFSSPAHKDEIKCDDGEDNLQRCVGLFARAIHHVKEHFGNGRLKGREGHAVTSGDHRSVHDGLLMGNDKKDGARGGC